MKFKSLIFSILIIISLQSFSQQTCKDFNLNGNVKSIKDVSYQGRVNKGAYEKMHRRWPSNWGMDCKSEFDTNGNLLKETFYASETKIQREETHTYTDGKLIKSETLYFTKTYKYDVFGKLIYMKEISRQPDIINASNTNKTGKEIISYYKYFYDEQDRLVEKHEYSSNGEKYEATKYRYDKDNKLIKEVCFYGDYKEWFTYEYDTNGNLTQKSWYDEYEGLVERESFTYENSLKSQELWELFQDGESIGSVTYNFERGNETETIEADEFGNIEEVTSCQYKYDQQGNWTQKITTINEKSIFIVEREIQYY